MSVISRQFVWNRPDKRDGDDVLATVLRNRFGDDVDVDRFFNPEFSLADPFLMRGMEAAIDRLRQAYKNKEKVCVYGDYDADGLTAAALMFELLSWLGFEVEVFIPNRYDYGYGLKKENLDKIKADLVITVDCGIRAKSVIDECSHIDFIITDHHQVGEVLPDCAAVINPHQPLCKYPFKDLAGVGVGYVLARGLLSDWEGITKDKADWWLKWNLDLVALGTVADMMPLVGENRILVKYGLQVITNRRRAGLDYLLKVAGKKDNQLTSFDLAFLVGPRLNAVGRLGAPLIGWEVLVTKDAAKAQKLALELNQINQCRRQEVDRIVDQILPAIDSEKKVIMAAGEGWLRGLLGLVAGKMADKYNRPVFLAEIDGNKMVGSVRGVDGVNVEQLLSQSADWLENFGGHEQAGGFSLDKSKWSDFQQSIWGLMDGLDLDKPRVIDVDIEMEAEKVKLDYWDVFKRMHPLGVGNPELSVLVENVPVISQRQIGKTRDHTKFEVDLGGKKIEALYWGSGARLAGTHIEKMNLVGNFQDNHFNNQINKIINIMDMEVVDG